MTKLICILLMLPTLALSATLKELNSKKPPYTLPQLSYSYDALKPNIDAQTMTTHHSLHHKAYVDKTNAALDANSKNENLLDLLRNTTKYSLSIRNNAGGHWNHSFFWTILTPEAKQTKINPTILKAIEKDFGSFDKFKADFETSAASVFGSGWIWLILHDKNVLKITTAPNQDNPLMDISNVKGKPILALDVWEHAYYLAYQNRRAEYVTNFWKIINWDQVYKYYLEKI